MILTEIRWFFYIIYNISVNNAEKFPFKVIISVTSYPERFSTLHFTLKCLLTQRRPADGIVLWVSHDDIEKIPRSVRRLEKYGVSIKVCKDTKSYKKLVPSLIEYPEYAIITVDDDLYYKSDLTNLLLGAYDESEKEVLCLRAHKIVLDPRSHLPAPYLSWESETGSTSPSKLIFPTGGAGALYIPGTLPPEVLNDEAFMRLCPTGDDIWFYWMASRAGSVFRRVGRRRRLVSWSGTQASSLWQHNQGESGNDLQIEDMLTVYGAPWVEDTVR